jgi:hypothetical protein
VRRNACCFSSPAAKIRAPVIPGSAKDLLFPNHAAAVPREIGVANYKGERPRWRTVSINPRRYAPHGSSLHPRSFDHLRRHEVGTDPLGLGDHQIEHLSSGCERSVGCASSPARSRM